MNYIAQCVVNIYKVLDNKDIVIAEMFYRARDGKLVFSYRVIEPKEHDNIAHQVAWAYHTLEWYLNQPSVKAYHKSIGFIRKSTEIETKEFIYFTSYNYKTKLWHNVDLELILDKIKGI